ELVARRGIDRATEWAVVKRSAGTDQLTTFLLAEEPDREPALGRDRVEEDLVIRVHASLLLDRTRTVDRDRSFDGDASQREADALARARPRDVDAVARPRHDRAPFIRKEGREEADVPEAPRPL